MNNFEVEKGKNILKLLQNRVENVRSPLNKGKKLPKEAVKAAKRYKKRSHTPTIEKIIGNTNTSALKRSSSNHISRSRSKGSVSVEIFNRHKEIQRPNSVISKSFYNHIELVDKVKKMKQHFNQLSIDNIIKKSLIKAKSNKLNKERKRKSSIIQNEIKKQEIRYQNDQIRLQNSKKIKKPRKKSKKSLKLEKIQISKPENKKKTNDYAKDYLNKIQEVYLKNYGNTKENSDYSLKKDLNFFDLSEIEPQELSEESDFKPKIQKISSGSKSEISDNSKELEKTPEEKYKNLKIEKQLPLKISRSPVYLSSLSYSISIFPKAKSLQSAPQSSIIINPVLQTLTLSKFELFKKKQSNLTISTTSISQFSTTKPETRPDELIEEISTKKSYLYLIEKLKLLESETTSNLSTFLPAEVFKNISDYTEKKFSAITNFINLDLELAANAYLSKLNFLKNSEFFEKTEKKKLAFQNLLNDFKLAYKDQQIKDESSDEQIKIISHSRSVPRLHEVSEEQGENKEKEIDFGYKENSEGIQFNYHCNPFEETDRKPIMNSETMLKYAESVLETVNKEETIKAISEPLSKDPLSELDKIQDLQIGSFTDTEICQFTQLFDYARCLNLDLWTDLKLDQELQGPEKSYKKAVLDCLNYLIQQFRPYGYKGKPFPWLEKRAYFYREVKSFDEIYYKILKDLNDLLATCIGKHEELDDRVSQNENEIIKVKEKQLDLIIYNEALKEEESWLNFNFEETQVKIDLADIILYDLITELITINNKP